MVAEGRQACVYNRLECGVHELILAEASREMVDELLVHMTAIHGSAAPGERLRVLVDSRMLGLPPVAYLFQRVRQWLMSEPAPNPGQVAFLLGDITLVWLVDSLLKTILRTAAVEIRYFDSSDREAAIRWLLLE